MDNLMGPFWRGGPSPGSFYNFPGGQVSSTSNNEATKRTMQPIVTGTSVLGMKFEGGVMIAADTLGSYGSLARFRNLSRIMKVNDTTVLAASGDYADYQYVKSVLDQMVIDEESLDDGLCMTAPCVFSWMTRVLYNRRSKFNPLWNTMVVAGYHDTQSFLGCVDKIGTAFESESIATGFGSYLAQPLMRKALEENRGPFTEEKARKVIEDCLKVLYYRDARSYNRYEISTVRAQGVTIENPKAADTNWDVAHYVRGFE
uniref:proteasome subunit beta type-4-like n=1 Tax=Styela clava TaxID=7725 RepID=UPI0019396D0F|nr:proteasome subunit beta type-4-like [Styela clava]